MPPSATPSRATSPSLRSGAPNATRSSSHATRFVDCPCARRGPGSGRTFSPPTWQRRAPGALVLVVTAAALTGVAPLVLAPEPAATSQTGPGVQLLDDARRAAQEQDFSGVLGVTWSDATGEHNNDVFVRSSGGVLALGDRPSVIVEGARRFVQGPDGWLAVWSRETKPDIPPASDKWKLSVRDWPSGAGRGAREIDATDRRHGKVRERLYVDESTSLLLRREAVGTRGGAGRGVCF